MRVIVCGGRDFADAEWLFAVLDQLHARRPFTLLRQGGQMMRHPADSALKPPKQRRIGADYLAKRWAISRMVNHEEVKADWSKFGAAAGPIRNGMMLRENDIDLVVGFPRLDGRLGDGTADMLEKARKAEIRTIEVVRRPDFLAMRSPEPEVETPETSVSGDGRAIPLHKPAPAVHKPPPEPQLTLI